MPQSFIRRGIVIVLTMSGLALLDKSGWGPLGSGEDDTHPVFIALVGVGMIVRAAAGLGPDPAHPGLPMFGAPTVAELEGETPPGGTAPSAVGAGAGDDQTQAP